MTSPRFSAPGRRSVGANAGSSPNARPRAHQNRNCSVAKWPRPHLVVRATAPMPHLTLSAANCRRPRPAPRPGLGPLARLVACQNAFASLCRWGGGHPANGGACGSSRARPGQGGASGVTKRAAKARLSCQQETPAACCRQRCRCPSHAPIGATRRGQSGSAKGRWCRRVRRSAR